MNEPLLLASASPRRREIVASLGLPFDTASVDADETLRAGEAPDAYLRRVVDDKLTLAIEIARGRGRRVVVVADTTVIVDGGVLVKPLDPADNRAMIARLAGREHDVKTRFAVAVVGGATKVETVRTVVRFRALAPAAIDAYVVSGEGRDKAGGYAIQGLGSFLVSSITGSYSNVVGLPACELVVALEALGVLTSFPLT